MNCDELDESRRRSNSNDSRPVRGRREVDTSVYEDTLQRPSTGILHNGRDRVPRGGSLGRRTGVVSSSRLPIQHEIRFPGSNIAPPHFPILSPTLPRRKRSASVPEGLNQIFRGRPLIEEKVPLVVINVSIISLVLLSSILVF